VPLSVAVCHGVSSALLYNQQSSDSDHETKFKEGAQDFDQLIASPYRLQANAADRRGA
jgi:hypothetical protein